MHYQVCVARGVVIGGHALLPLQLVAFEAYRDLVKLLQLGVAEEAGILLAEDENLDARAAAKSSAAAQAAGAGGAQGRPAPGALAGAPRPQLSALENLPPHPSIPQICPVSCGDAATPLPQQRPVSCRDASNVAQTWTRMREDQGGCPGFWRLTEMSICLYRAPTDAG